jgi:hypothetical protein
VPPHSELSDFSHTSDWKDFSHDREGREATHVVGIPVVVLTDATGTIVYYHTAEAIPKNSPRR